MPHAELILFLDNSQSLELDEMTATDVATLVQTYLGASRDARLSVVTKADGLPMRLGLHGGKALPQKRQSIVAGSDDGNEHGVPW